VMTCGLWALSSYYDTEREEIAQGGQPSEPATSGCWSPSPIRPGPTGALTGGQVFPVVGRLPDMQRQVASRSFGRPQLLPPPVLMLRICSWPRRPLRGQGRIHMDKSGLCLSPCLSFRMHHT
jgi:hypothetical protein